MMEEKNYRRMYFATAALIATLIISVTLTICVAVVEHAVTTRAEISATVKEEKIGQCNQQCELEKYEAAHRISQNAISAREREMLGR